MLTVLKEFITYLLKFIHDLLYCEHILPCNNRIPLYVRWHIFFHKSFLTICNLQVQNFLSYFSHKQPDDGYCVAETCSCHLKLLQWSCVLKGHISALNVYCRGTKGILHVKISWPADAMLESLKGWGTWSILDCL